MKSTNKIKAAKLLMKLGGQIPESFFVPKPVKPIGYTLTDKDKQDIASRISVPIVEKVIERVQKTEVVLERPTITEVTKIIKELDKEELQRLMYEFLSRNWNGGGNANRNEQINSVNVLRPFTDINWITGSGITMNAVPNQTTKYTDITVTATGGTGGFQQPTSGVVDGSNQVFTWTTAPTVIVVDQGRAMQKVSSDGSVNWVAVGTTTTLTVAPNFDIFASA